MYKNIFYDGKTNKIHLWEIGENGKTIKTEESVQHEFYILDSRGEYKDHFDRNFRKVVTSSRKEMKLISEGMVTAETDLNVEFKYLHHRYLNTQMKPEISNFNIANIDIEIQNESPEFPFPNEAKYPINLITVEDINTGEFFTFGLEKYTGSVAKNYLYCKTELELLKSFVLWFRKKKFDIITGWNVNGFDIPYIVNRIINITKGTEYEGLEEKLSPINVIIHGKDDVKKIAGLSSIDYMPLYKNFTFTELDSYSLQNVCMVEIKEGKLEFEGQINTIWKTDWNTFVDYNIQDVALVSKLDRKKKFLKLAIVFCYEALIPLEKFEATVATIEGVIWKELHADKRVMLDRKEDSVDWFLDEKYYIVKKPNGEIEYQNCKTEEGEFTFEKFKVKGGHVEAVPGYYKNVISYDVESEYPHEILQYNISPETKVIKPSEEQVIKENLIKSCVNGVYYKRTEGAILPKITEKFFRERKYYKNLMFKAANEHDKVMEEEYDSLQHVRKIFINSIYGACANEGFHYFDADNARAITRGGRVLIRFLSKSIKDFSSTIQFHNDMNKLFDVNLEHEKSKQITVPVLDTDSSYLCLSKIRESYAKDMEDSIFYKKIDDYLQNFFNKILDIKAKRENVKQVIRFKREGLITDQLVLAKKKYASRLLAKEDVVYDPPKFKATGIDIQQSSTPKFCKITHKEIIEDIFDNNSKESNFKLLNNIKTRFFDSDYNDIAGASSVNNVDKYFNESDVDMETMKLVPAPHMPMHVKAAIFHNMIVKKKRWQYSEILNGAKIKFIRIKTDNPLKANVIAWIGKYPKEFSGLFNVDYELQFKKEITQPVQRMWDALGWGVIDYKRNKMRGLLD